MNDTRVLGADCATPSGEAGRRLGEVLEASTTEFRAAIDVLHEAPPFGSLVRASDGRVDVLGLVFDSTTGSADPGRPAIVRGRNEVDEGAVYDNNPQLGLLLRTEIKAVVVGFSDGEQVRQYLPARPPRVHAFVWPAGPEIESRFFLRLDYLALLIGSRVAAPLDELIAASLRLADGDDDFVVRAGKELVSLLGGEPIRLSPILRKLRS